MHLDEHLLCGKWININDEIPSDKESVLVTDGEKIGITNLLISDNKIATQLGLKGFKSITHWMFLPNLPERVQIKKKSCKHCIDGKTFIVNMGKYQTFEIDDKDRPYLVCIYCDGKGIIEHGIL